MHKCTWVWRESNAQLGCSILRSIFVFFFFFFKKQNLWWRLFFQKIILHSQRSSSLPWHRSARRLQFASCITLNVLCVRAYSRCQPATKCFLSDSDVSKARMKPQWVRCRFTHLLLAQAVHEDVNGWKKDECTDQWSRDKELMRT